MTARDCDAVLSLWRGTEGIGLDDDCDSRRGLSRYLKRNPGLSFVACEGERLVGAVLSGHDGRRGYLHHLAVAGTHRKRGIGKALVARCLRSLAKRRIPKCNIFLLESNPSGRAFWQHNGWNLRTDLCVLQKKTMKL
jgi:ribosomal protein S18 acetylase RimI-like enzyme